MLIEVESSESLKRYRLQAPFDGIITTQHATKGELTDNEALFTVANFEQVWAEFQIFPGQIRRVAAGQAIEILAESEKTTSRLQHLIPSATGQPFVVARAAIDNREGLWTPGLLLQGKISIKQKMVELRIDNRALQNFEGLPVIFINEGDEYSPRKITLGLRDSKFSEVLDGLNAGEKYVVENSYLIKADLEKSGASHEH
ncbi:MAG: efflux RND transporter periplasmic adaptor subunit [Pseudomonadales bacterium]|nr:efflux RND transporter periplasmic adaptor subunit [Pseudomonadales bacterium]